MFRTRKTDQSSPPAPLERKLEDGGWFNARSAVELISWTSYAPPALSRYRLLRTSGGTVILEYPEPAVVLAGIRTTDTVLYRTLTPRAACEFLLANRGPRDEAEKVFPAEWRAATEQHRSQER